MITKAWIIKDRLVSGGSKWQRNFLAKIARARRSENGPGWRRYRLVVG
jgi:hypothetical protein